MDKLIELSKNYSTIPFLIAFSVAYSAYYLLSVAKKPRVVANQKFKSWLLKRCPLIEEKFWPTPWCFGTYAQTIIRSILKSGPEIPYRRELLRMPDGGQVALDWVDNDESRRYPDPSSRPTVIILPGLTGCSRETYVLHLCEQTMNLGYRAVVFNNRGNGGVKLLTPRTYNACNPEDLSQVVKHVKATFVDAPLAATGVSLGGIILGHYVSQTGGDCGLLGIMSISSCWNTFLSSDSLERPVNAFLFNKILTNGLVSAFKRNIHLFEGDKKYLIDKVLNSKSIRDFDEHFTSKQFNYPSHKEYYKDSSLCTKIHDIRVPMLCLNAADDIFAPEDTIPLCDAEQSKHVGIVMTSHGGHIGFLEGLYPRHAGYADRLYSQYIEAVFEHSEELQSL